MSSRKNKAKRDARRFEADFGYATSYATTSRTAITAAKALFPTAVSPVAPVAPKPAPTYAAPVAPTYTAPVAPKPAPTYAAPVAPKPAAPVPPMVVQTPTGPITIPGQYVPPVITATVAPAPTESSIERMRREAATAAAVAAAAKAPVDRGTYPAYIPPAAPTYEPETVWDPPPFVTSSSAPLVTSAQFLPVPIAPKKLGIIARILAFFGFVKAESKIAGDVPMSRVEAAGSLVRRARQGDQNAMALIDIARQNAQRGNVQAKLAVACIKDYIAKNPVSFAGEFFKRDLTMARAIHLSRGPSLLGNPGVTLALLRAHSGPDEEKAFARAVHGARRLQALARRDIPVSRVDPMIGWELGE